MSYSLLMESEKPMENKLLAQSKRVNYIFLFLLLGLLLLRFPFEIGMCLNRIPISKTMGLYIFEDGTYLITAILMILKRNLLSDYNIGRCSLIIFMVAPVAELFSDYSMNLPSSGAWFRIGISACLLVVLLFYRPKLRKRSIKEILLWGLISVVVGICLGVFNGRMISLQGNGVIYRPSVRIIAQLFLIQLSNAAVIEEPLFRGFLWGFLKQLRWKDYWIWLFQTALFWLGHIFYLGVSNYSFWTIVPLGALTMGLVAWRSRSIGTSMIVHGLSNALGHFIW